MIIETDDRGKLSERRFSLAEYLSSGERGVLRLKELIATLIDE